ncbi:MAG TPA: hypothetical protein DEB15_02810 [Pusillimonas sp.]|nr:hypothetical protein [Pusillimonas sp.]MBC41647.1 hypothetical protein [Pusillimonas sp.]HBT31826.1 hypothetical protein [Pusillimonas sp.]HCN72621.1 hypothetical protein [Pusillimonas sp.]
MSSSPCRAELLAGADEQDRGINGGDPPGGEDAVYAAKARAADTVGGTVGVLGGALRAMGTTARYALIANAGPRGERHHRPTGDLIGLGFNG